MTLAKTEVHELCPARELINFLVSAQTVFYSLIMKTIYSPPTLFETTDLGLASTLFARGYAITCLKHDGGQRYRFCFLDTPDLQKLIKAFWDRRLTIEPQCLFECHRALKARAHNSSSYV